jgi:hypothetical protein
MEEAVLNDKEISDYLDKYDISYWNYIVPRLVKIAIRDIEKNKPDIYTIDEIDEYLKEKDPNPQIEEKDPYEGMWPENSQNDNLEIKDLNSSSPQNDFSNQNKNDFQNNEYSNENENKYISPIDKQYKKNLQNSYENPMNTSYNNPIKSTLDNSYKYNDYQSPIKNYNHPINNSYQNSIKNSYDIGYKPSNYLMNPMNNYSNRNNYSSLETRARSPRYTYECNPSNYGNNSYRNNSFRNPSFGSQRSNLPNLNYDYNNYRLRRNNFDDDCCNKSAQFLSTYTYRPNYTSGY